MTNNKNNNNNNNKYYYSDIIKKKKIIRAYSEAILILESMKHQFDTLQERVRFDDDARIYFGSLIANLSISLVQLIQKKDNIKKIIDDKENKEKEDSKNSSNTQSKD